MVDVIWLSQHRHLNTPPQNGCREMSRFVHKAVNIMLQFFVVSTIEDRQFVHETLQFLHRGMSNPSFLPTCPQLLVAHVLSDVCHVFQRTQLVHRNETELVQLLRTHIVCTSKCFALRPGPRRCMMALALLLSVQTSIWNVRAVWCSIKCFTYRASTQPFVIALASDSAEDSDTVACVTDQ